MQDLKNNTALLVMDMQAGTLANIPGDKPFINYTAKAIAFARNNKIPVIYVTVGFRNGAPEVSASNKSFASRMDTFASINMQEFMKIEEALKPLPQDIIVTKRRISAFTGSDLEVVLRAKGIQHIVLAGIATSGVVLSTIREAADKDYRITVLSNCCADADEEVHSVLVSKIFPRQADVITSDEWAKGN